MKRYTPVDVRDEFPAAMIEHPEGKYILYSEVAKIKADAIREAAGCTRLTNYPHLCKLEGLLAHADKLEEK